jgi:hypothetical protein
MEEAMKLHGSRRRPRRSRILHAAAAGLALWALGACDGDTLYDTTPGGGPAVQIVAPVPNAQVQAGRPIAVRVEASDTLGITELSITYRGVESGALAFEFVPPQTTVSIDTVIVLQGTGTGQLEVQATSRNTAGRSGSSAVVALSVSATDTEIPSVGLTADVPARVELTDSIRATVTARDNEGGSGIALVGVTALVHRTGSADTVMVARSVAVSPAATGTVVRSFAFAPPVADATMLPDTLRMTLHAFAVDSAGNCAAAVAEGPQRLACREIERGGVESVIASGVAEVEESIVVAGCSVALAAGSLIADIAPDTLRRRLYISNLERNRVEVLNLNDFALQAPVSVGSLPWGLALNRGGDTLIVANSGGTSLSFVQLAGTPQEVLARRLQTPNQLLFEVQTQPHATGTTRLYVRFFDFSDRPQFVAQDAAGRLLYSTRPTGAAPDGTIRVATMQQGWQTPHVRMLFGRDLVTIADSTRVSIINVDSVRVFSDAGDDEIEIYDHVPGFPNQVISSGVLPLFDAIAAMENQGSDIRWAPGRFDMTLVGLSDTTYVAASADRTRVAFGEGAVGGGRIFLWNSPTASISNEISVSDLVSNASERIFGVDLNSDGTLGAARGSQAAYYFRDDLRLQGHSSTAAGTGSGAALHPEHPSYSGVPAPGPTTLSFVADGNRIRIVDTVHFHDRGEIPIRDDIVGTVRVTRPLPGENTGCTPGDDCIVAKLYGVTGAGSVVVVNVYARDIQ